MKKILVIDDEENMRHMLSVLLQQAGYHISLAPDGQKGLEAVDSKTFDAILCDIRMPNIDGIEFLTALRKRNNSVPVVMMSAFGTVSLAVEAMKQGACDFVTKPFQGDEVLISLEKVIKQQKLEDENRELRKQILTITARGGFDRLIGTSNALMEIVKQAQKIAPYKTTVLITGESGTGKELLAQGIHTASSRKDKPFVPINCGSIPDNLLESELFGHIKGAFTGAEQTRKGLFEEAKGGTLFLDEIGELPVGLQVKLLRVLQENEYRPVGSSKSATADTRIIAATSRNLEKEISDGNFREDLYFRLNVMHLEMPPLRERIDDVALLAHFFLDKVNLQTGKTIKGISPSTMKQLVSYNWPGNVRELENVIERAALLAEISTLEPDDLPPNLLNRSPSTENTVLQDTISIKQGQKILEKKLIIKALHKTKGNKSKAAALLEISYPSLLNKIKVYKI